MKHLDNPLPSLTHVEDHYVHGPQAMHGGVQRVCGGRQAAPVEALAGPLEGEQRAGPEVRQRALAGLREVVLGKLPLPAAVLSPELQTQVLVLRDTNDNCQEYEYKDNTSR